MNNPIGLNFHVIFLEASLWQKTFVAGPGDAKNEAHGSKHFFRAHGIVEGNSATSFGRYLGSNSRARFPRVHIYIILLNILRLLLRVYESVKLFRPLTQVMVTNSSAAVGWMATVSSKSILRAPIFSATANPCIISSAPIPKTCRPTIL
jgi:hypothetical protein